MSQDNFSLGILFVHGIGTQRKGETLTNFGGGLYQWLVSAKDRGERRHFTDVTLGDARLVAPEDPGAPAHASLTLHPVAQTPVRWLLAESWWAEAFAAPSFTDLASWGVNIVPWTLGSHFGAHVRAIWVRRDENTRTLDWATWVMRLTRGLVGLAASLVLSVAALAALVLMLIVALVPISSLRKWLGTVQQVLAASIGDSYTFVARPFEAAAIVGQVRRDLRWLSDRCDHLVIVAHSQGAAVSFRAIRDDVPSKLRLFFTLGSGLRKLVELEHIMKSGGRFQRAAFFTLGGLLLAPAALIVISAMYQNPAVLFRDQDPISWVILSAEALISVALLIAGFVDFTRGFGRDLAREEGETLAHTKMRWVDCYSTADAVPNGATFETQPEIPASNAPKQFSIEVCNSRSISADHTSYWANLDEFVSIVAAALQLSGVPGLPAIETVDADWLTAIRRRRRWRVAFLVGVRWSAAFGAVAALVRYWQEYSAIAMWGLAVGSGWLRSMFGLPATPAPARPSLWHAALIASVVAGAYLAARIAWNRWNASEASDLLRYRVPRNYQIATVMCLAIQLGIAISIATDGVRLGPSIILMIAIAVISSVVEPRVPSAGRVTVTDSAEDVRYTQLVVDLVKALFMPVVMLGLLISSAAAAYRWLGQRYGLSAETLASATTWKILASVAVLAVVALVARSLALRGRRVRAVRKTS
jgi:hypothetical protein